MCTYYWLVFGNDNFTTRQRRTDYPEDITLSTTTSPSADTNYKLQHSSSVKMKIYFCGSVQGGRQDAELYASIIDELKSKYGEVLTEFVGSPTVEQDEIKLGSKEVHQLCLTKLKSSMLLKISILVLIAEVTQPSLGVGYEIGRAVGMDKKILCLFRPNSLRKLSSMIAGLHDSHNVTVKNYDGQDFKDILKVFFTNS
ncbi:DNPH1 [Mytilus coruscus]|uniref:Putative 2'-deoxynucleoside 5'-phosphate N-hydrolase 1 n=1 Tax=Mytilus coruscus TaxID=42192 RepID=A0A6J8BW73_MYTCO|nr:DNPH1 [Mytilus coruscus]